MAFIQEKWQTPRTGVANDIRNAIFLQDILNSAWHLQCLFMLLKSMTNVSVNKNSKCFHILN